MEEFTLNIFNLLSVLLAAWAGGLIARKVGYPPILGELIIGILLGPGILGLIDYSTTIKVLADIGIILLMVYIGMEIDFRDLKKASWAGLLAALGGFIVPFTLGYLTIIWFGGTSTAALFVAIAVGVTSLATKSRILVDLKLLNTRIAYVLMAGALISDTLALLIFAGIVGFAKTGILDFTTLAVVLLKTTLFFSVTISIGLFVFPIIGKYLTRSKIKDSTFYFTVILIVAFGFSELAELAGLHNILGAFVAGLFIKDKLFPKNISKEVTKAFYDVSIGFMAPIFFVSAGFFVDINVFHDNLPLLITVVFVAISGKILGTVLFYLPSGYGWREGFTVGAGMNGRGAVEIIIAGIGLNMGIIDKSIFSILVFMAIFTTMTVPFLLKWTSNWLRNRNELVLITSRENTLILGVNPISLLLAEHLKPHTPVVMMDINKRSVNHAIQKGFNCVFGNALVEEDLAEANPENAAAFIGLTDNSEVNMLAAQLARESFLVPANYVAISKNEDGVGIDLLKTIKAASIFAKKIQVEEWCRRILYDETIEKEVLINEQMQTQIWVKDKKTEDEDFLPIIIQNKSGKKRPFYYDDTIEAGEKIIYLKSQLH